MEIVNKKALNTSEKRLLQQLTNLVQDDLQPVVLIISCDFPFASIISIRWETLNKGSIFKH